MERWIFSSDRGYGLAFEIRLLLARLNLLLEGLWRHGLLFFCVIGLFVGLSLLDIWSFTGGALHLAGLTVFGLVAVYSLYKGARRFKSPSRKRALRYLERRNQLCHRPLQTLGEHSEAEKKNNTPASHMWRVYQKSLRRNLKDLRTGLPNLDMGVEDGYALRALVILLLVAAFLFAGPKSGERLVAAIAPDIGPAAVPLDVTAWITPPAYTAQAPVLLKVDQEERSENGDKTYVIPAQSAFIAHVFGGPDAVPVLVKDGEELEFIRVDGRNFQIETTFDKPTQLQIRQDGDVIGSWRLNVIADAPPSINLIVPPEVTDRAAFKLQYRALDDYGVVRIGSVITKDDSAEKIELNLPSPGRGSKQVVGKSYHDLTAHPWAGLPVTLKLFAEDQVGQKGYSDYISLVLPERTFTHPVAKVLIEQRKSLVSDAEGSKENVEAVLDALTILPENLNNDVTAMLLLSTTRAILANGEDQKSVDEAIDMLWETALRLENGDLSMAEAELRAAQQALMDALNNGASDNEIKKLVEELRQAMDKFLQALAEQGKDMAAPQIDPNSDNQLIEAQDLKNLLDKIDQFARSGARDAARQLLSELQDIMENLKNARRSQPSASQQAGQKMLNELGKLMQQQQQLLDDTFRKSQKGKPGDQQQQNGSPSDQPGQQPGQQGGLQDLAKNQEALRQMLGDLMGRLGMDGEIPQGLGRAERSMNGARQSLEQGQGQSAMQSESEALENMRQGAEALAQQMMQNGQGQGTQSAGPGQSGRGRDPLGRSMEEEGGDGQISDAARMRGEASAFSKSRGIRDEVQRRLSDPARSHLERDYLQRLLDIF
ncbi:MAG: TIGR02302 family protein [Sneathiella sp.]|nr:TIGR02302 family protein [Sneathiella sp.]